MVLLDGKKTSAEIRAEIKESVQKLVAEGKKRPHLAAVLVGGDGASITYVNAKIKDCEEVGFDSSLVTLPDDISQDELLKAIDNLNNDDEIDGFIVQLPLPKHIDEKSVIEAIDPNKDVDGFHPQNVGKMTLNLPSFVPATPKGIVEILKRYNIETEGKHCVVVGRSHIVGSPISILMARNEYPGNCTVTITHSRTQDFESICRSADILIVALGKPQFIKADMIKEGVVIVDVGITRVEDSSKKSGWRLLGDVDFESVKDKVSYITPVPGGVGPMTRAALMQNTLLTSTLNKY